MGLIRENPLEASLVKMLRRILAFRDERGHDKFSVFIALISRQDNSESASASDQLLFFNRNSP